MRAGGKIAARVLNLLKNHAKIDVTTIELEKLAQTEIAKAGAKPSFYGYRGYPFATCISINDEIVHGLPSARRICGGDVVGLDVGVFYRGFHTDTALTVGVGKISPQAQKLIKITKQSLSDGLKIVRPGAFLGDVQAVIQKTVEDAGFNVIRDLCGHGVGQKLQEDPPIPNFGSRGKGLILKERMTLAIEPMVSAGAWRVKLSKNGWTVKIADGSLGAHFEHTIVVTPAGCAVLTNLE